MRLMIAEKYAQALSFIEAGIVPDDTHILLTIGFGLWRYKIPKMKFSDVPFTGEPSEIEPRFNWLVPKLIFTPDKSVLVGTGKPMHPEEYRVVSKSEKASQLHEMLGFLMINLHKYEEIILCVDNDRTGMWSARQILELLPQEQLPPVYCVRYGGTDAKSLQKGWNKRTDYPWQEGCFGYEFAAQHKVKKYFDYWWYCNSMLVFNELCKKSGLATTTLMSKYEFMLICIIGQQENPISDCKLYKLMERWKGTGKYDGKDMWGIIGSAASRTSIIANAVERGALSKGSDKNQPISITEKGRNFLAGLHPKSFDPDMPFRLEAWCIDENFEAPTRYIRTLFGRQLRYQRKQFKCSGVSQLILNAFEENFDILGLMQPEKDVPVSDFFHLCTSEQEFIGTLEVSALQSGHYKAKVKFQNSTYSEVIDSEEEIAAFAAKAAGSIYSINVKKKGL